MPRRILLLITDLEIGGTPTVVRELATRLHAPPQVEVEVACLSKWGPVADQIQAAGVPVTAMDARGAKDLLSVVRRVRALVRESGVDTVFSFLVHANFVAALASQKLPGVRFLQSIQTTQPAPRWHWRVQRFAHRAAEKVIVPSASVAEAAHAWSAIARGKVVVIPNAVDPDAFRRSQVPQTNPRPYPIGFIGRLDRIKRVDWLLNEVLILSQSPGLVHLHIYGDGPERECIRSKIMELKLDHVVTMHGTVSRPQDVLAALGALVLPSLAEGFGLVLIEAMAAGVPVVATNVPGIRDVVRDGQTGLLIRYDQPVAISVAIRRLIGDRELCDRLIRNGLVEVRERFSWDRVLLAYRQLLRLD